LGDVNAMWCGCGGLGGAFKSARAGGTRIFQQIEVLRGIGKEIIPETPPCEIQFGLGLGINSALAQAQINSTQLSSGLPFVVRSAGVG